MSQIDVTVSIVSYNSKNVLKNCIESIIKTAQDIETEIIVVDNCSEDGSADIVKAHFPDVRLIENRINIGFGQAHNQSFRLSKGKYFLILNPDTIIFPNAINKMVEFMDGHEHVGVVGCKIFWDDEKKFIFPDLRIHSLKTALMQFTPFCRYFPNSLISKWYWKSAHIVWKTKTPIKVEGISGGSMMIRRKVFESVGGFDDNFFLFFEEHDLLRRISMLGWDIFYIPDIEIQHFFEESCRKCSFDIGKISIQSALYYYKKHYGDTGRLFLKWLMKINNALFRIEKWSKKYFPFLQPNLEIVTPNNEEKILIRWDELPETAEYLVEVSYNLNFADRGGCYTRKNELLLSSLILNRLPNNTGFLRIIAIKNDNSTGKVLKLIKITSPYAALT